MADRARPSMNCMMSWAVVISKSLMALGRAMLNVHAADRPDAPAFRYFL